MQAVLDLVNGRRKEVFDATPREAARGRQAAAGADPVGDGGHARRCSPRAPRRSTSASASVPDWTYIALLFDGKYPLAAALVNRRLTFREYERKVIFDPVVQAMIDKIELVPDLSMGVFGAEAELELADGRAFVSRQDCIADFPVREKLDDRRRGHPHGAPDRADRARRRAARALRRHARVHGRRGASRPAKRRRRR